MKPWYWSRTLWVNALALLLTWWLGRADFYVNPQWVIVGLVLLNLGLRVITKEAVRWKN